MLAIAFNNIIKYNLTVKLNYTDFYLPFCLLYQAILSLCINSETFDGFVLYLKAKLKESDGSVKYPLVTEHIDKSTLKGLLLDPDLSSRLQLLGGAIVQDWQPLELLESNLEVLARRNLSWFVDGLNEKPLFMSFHTPIYPIPYNGGSLRFNIDMFGTDASLAKRALTAHLNTVKGEIQSTVLIHIYMNTSLWEVMRRFCEGFDGVKQWRNYWEQTLLERELAWWTKGRCWEEKCEERFI